MNKYFMKSLLITILVVISLMLFTNVRAYANTTFPVGFGIEPIKVSNDYPIILYEPILYQDNESGGDGENSEKNNDEVELDEIDPEDKYPIWDIVGKKYYETPFRRFDIIFFASFSYLLLLNVTIIETISALVPYFGGRFDFSSLNAAIEGFGLPLIIYALTSSVIFAVAVAVEDYRFVYIKSAHLRNRKKNEQNEIKNLNSNKESSEVEVYFAPLLVARGNSVDFGLLLINF